MAGKARSWPLRQESKVHALTALPASCGLQAHSTQAGTEGGAPDARECAQAASQPRSATSRHCGWPSYALRPGQEHAAQPAHISCLARPCCRCRPAQGLPACEAGRALAAGVSTWHLAELASWSPVGAPLNELDSHSPPLFGCAQLHKARCPVGQIADLGVLWVPPASHITCVHLENWKIR